MGRSYKKNGAREYGLLKQKDAVKQLGNFANILTNMNILSKEIENYNGIITESNLESICKLINLDKKLNLTDHQINIIMKPYLEPKVPMTPEEHE